MKNLITYKKFFESTDDVFVHVRKYDKVKNPTKAYGDKYEDEDEEDIEELGEFDTNTPNSYKDLDTVYPTGKHNSLADGATNMP